MPRTSIPSSANSAELVAAGIVEYGIHIGEGGWAQAAVGQLLQPVGQAADEEGPVVPGWVCADQIAPALLQL